MYHHKLQHCCKQWQTALRSMCFVLLCQLGLFISNRGLYTRVLFQLKTKSVGVLYSLYIQLFCSAKSHFWVSSCITLPALEKNKSKLNLKKKRECKINCLFTYFNNNSIFPSVYQSTEIPSHKIKINSFIWVRRSCWLIIHTSFTYVVTQRNQNK